MKKQTLLLLCWLFGAWPIMAQDPLPMDKHVKMGRLSNGLTYYIRENGKPENQVELRLVVDAGSVLEEDDQQGLAHFVEHMCFNGSAHFEKNSLVDYLQTIGVKFGAHLNAYTSFDETVYILPVPTEREGILDTAFQILEDWAHNVSFEGEDIDEERGIILEERRSRLGADDRMLKVTLPVYMHNSKYANRLPIGTEEVLKTFEHERLREFYRDWYRPDLMAVVVVGDIDAQEMEAKIEEYFGRIPKPEEPKERTRFEVPDHNETLVAIATDPEAAFSSISVMWKHPFEPEKTQEDFRQSLIRGLYSEMVNARMSELANSSEPPFLGGDVGYGRFMGGKSVYAVSVNPKEEDMLKGLRAALIENRRALLHGFNASELERAKSEYMAYYEKQYRERNKQRSSAIVGGYVDHFLRGNVPLDQEQQFEMIQQMMPKISLNDVNEVPRHLIRDKSRIVVVEAPEKEDISVPTEQEILQLLKETDKLQPEPYEDAVVAENLIEKLPKAGKVLSEKKLEKIDAVEWVLSNGAKVVLKKTDLKEDEIRLSAISPGGNSLYPDKEYITITQADEIVKNAGLANFSKVDLQKMMSGKIVSGSPYIGRNSEGYSGYASVKDFEQMMQMMYLYFTNPRENQKDFENYIERTKATYQNLHANPQYYFYDQKSRLLAQNHVRSGIFKAEEFDKVDYGRAYQVYRERFRDASDFTFFLIGNFEYAEARKMVETYIASLPAKLGNEAWKDLGIRPPKGKVSKTLRRGTEPKAQVSVVFAGELKNYSKHSLPMDALAEVLSIKLIENLREKIGGVYSTRANGSTRRIPNPSYNLDISFSCDPENVEKLIAAAIEEIEKIQAEGPTEKDLNKVKEAYRREWEKAQEENSFWINQIENMYFYGYDADQWLSYPERVNELSAKDVKKMAKKYLDTDAYIRLVMLPEEEAAQPKDE